MNPHTLEQVNGVHTNCSPAWNTLLNSMDNGLYGLQSIARSLIQQHVPWEMQTKSIVEDLTQDAIVKVYIALSDSNLILKDIHPGPLATVIMRNEIFRRLKQYTDSFDHVELEPDMIADSASTETDFNNIELIKRIREIATDKEAKVISKIIQGVPINHTERQRLYRLRSRLESQGVTLAHG